ncbi:MAG: hypothetical protein WCJ58_00875 [bacterium]
MGFFRGLGELVISPVRIVTKTADSMINDDWDDVDILSLGTSKIIKSVGEEAEDIEDAFDD